MKFIFLFFILPVISFAQKSFTGFVSNKITNQKIPFVTIGLVKENVGTNAGEDGNFILHSVNTKPNDTIIISCVGYQTCKLAVDNIPSQHINIELNEHQTDLTEVIVTNKRSGVSATINDFTDCGNKFIGSTGYQTQLAQHFRSPAPHALLTSIKICRTGSGFFDPEKTIFRIRVYNMDTLTGAPSVDLCDEAIEVKTRSKLIRLNLEKYKIHIPDKDFFVAIEWLKIPFNESRSVIKRDGKEFEYITYRPAIGWTNNVNGTMEAWSFDYKKIWRRMYDRYNKTSVAIAATLQY